MPSYRYGAKYIEVVKTELSDVVLYNQSSKEVLVIPLWELERVTRELTDLVIAEQEKRDKLTEIAKDVKPISVVEFINNQPTEEEDM
jgi:PHD/YefM family antitoxin component YafN of YafNO toxin-antitoxin module